MERPMGSQIEQAEGWRKRKVKRGRWDVEIERNAYSG